METDSSTPAQLRSMRGISVVIGIYVCYAASQPELPSTEPPTVLVVAQIFTDPIMLMHCRPDSCA
jgi:hypothetical protein